MRDVCQGNIPIEELYKQHTFKEQKDKHAKKKHVVWNRFEKW